MVENDKYVKRLRNGQEIEFAINETAEESED